MKYNRLLLTGAGFTKNYGAPLAAEMGSRIFNKLNNPDLRKIIRKCKFNYEEAYQKVLEGKFRTDDKQEIKEAIHTVFKEIEKDTQCGTHSTSLLCNDFVNRFTKNYGESSVIFTLNQDIFIEEHCYKANIQCIYPYVDRMFIPSQICNIDNNSIEAKISEYKRYVAKHNSAPYLSYFKLHGSINWRLEKNIKINSLLF
jgi:hypothetical protein